MGSTPLFAKESLQISVAVFPLALDIVGLNTLYSIISIENRWNYVEFL